MCRPRGQHQGGVNLNSGFEREARDAGTGKVRCGRFGQRGARAVRKWRPAFLRIPFVGMRRYAVKNLSWFFSRGGRWVRLLVGLRFTQPRKAVFRGNRHPSKTREPFDPGNLLFPQPRQVRLRQPPIPQQPTTQ